MLNTYMLLKLYYNDHNPIVYFKQQNYFLFIIQWSAINVQFIKEFLSMLCALGYYDKRICANFLKRKCVFDF